MDFLTTLSNFSYNITNDGFIRETIGMKKKITFLMKKGNIHIFIERQGPEIETVVFIFKFGISSYNVEVSMKTLREIINVNILGHNSKSYNIYNINNLYSDMKYYFDNTYKVIIYKVENHNRYVMRGESEIPGIIWNIYIPLNLIKVDDFLKDI